jgi:hypothetical protein
MFDALMYVLLFLPMGFPVVPWLFGARFGQRGIWLSTGFVLVILLLLPFLFFEACVAANCGQGAIAIFMLGPAWIAAALLTVMCAVLASYRLRLRGRD